MIQNWRAHSFSLMQPAHYTGEMQHFPHLNNSYRISKSPIFLSLSLIASVCFTVSSKIQGKKWVGQQQTHFFLIFKKWFWMFLVFVLGEMLKSGFWSVFLLLCSSLNSSFYFAWGHLHTSKSSKKSRTLF